MPNNPDNADRAKLLDLADCCEKATGPDTALDLEIRDALGLEWRADHLRFTASLDAAMTLLPETAGNHDLFSFVGHGREDIGGLAWGFNFVDTTKVMGERAALEEISRLRKDSPTLNKLRGEPLIYLEKAIAEHFIEFRGTHAATPALALCAAALRAQATKETGR